MERPPVALGGAASVPVTVSGGLVALAPETAPAGCRAAMARADAALYRAKAEGGTGSLRG